MRHVSNRRSFGANKKLNSSNQILRVCIPTIEATQNNTRENKREEKGSDLHGEMGFDFVVMVALSSFQKAQDYLDYEIEASRIHCGIRMDIAISKQEIRKSEPQHPSISEKEKEKFLPSVLALNKIYRVHRGIFPHPFGLKWANAFRNMNTGRSWIFISGRIIVQYGTRTHRIISHGANKMRCIVFSSGTLRILVLNIRRFLRSRSEYP
jgi:hypothetical protein